MTSPSACPNGQSTSFFNLINQAIAAVLLTSTKNIAASFPTEQQ